MFWRVLGSDGAEQGGTSWRGIWDEEDIISQIEILEFLGLT